MQGIQRSEGRISAYLTPINETKTMHRQIVVNQQCATLNKLNKLYKLNYGLIVHSR